MVKTAHLVFENKVFIYVHVCSVVSNFASPQTIACQASLSLGLPSKNTGVGYCFLLQGIFLSQGSSLCLLHWQAILYCWATREDSFYLHVLSTSYVESIFMKGNNRECVKMRVGEIQDKYKTKLFFLNLFA